MARCSICNGDGGMIAVHKACLHDLLEAAMRRRPVLCTLCASIQMCLHDVAVSGSECRDLFRLDQDKAQALIEEVGPRD